MSPRPPVEAPSRRGRPPDPDVLDVGGIPSAFADQARLAAIWTGFGAAALGCFVAVVVALAMWIPDAAATGTSGSTVRGGLLAFLAAQHGGVAVNGVGIGFIPLGMTWLALVLCRRSGRALWALPSVGGGDTERHRTVELLAVQVGAYALTTTLVSFYAVVGESSASPVSVALSSLCVGLVGFGSVALVATPLGPRAWLAVPAPVRTAARGGVVAVAVYLAGGALLALGSSVLRAGRFIDLSRGMGRGLSGLPIAIGDLLAAPNAVVAGASYLAGPGFAVGRHATYAPFGGHGGLVPAFPVLAGLPVGEHASLAVLGLLAVTVLGAGVAAAMMVRRETAAQPWTTALAAAAGSGVFAGAVLAGLCALAGGSLGAHQLSAVGASPLRVGLAVLLEVTCVCTATVGIGRLFARQNVDDAVAPQAEPVAPAARFQAIAGALRSVAPDRAPIAAVAGVAAVEAAAGEPGRNAVHDRAPNADRTPDDGALSADVSDRERDDDSRDDDELDDVHHREATG